LWAGSWATRWRNGCSPAIERDGEQAEESHIYHRSRVLKGFGNALDLRAASAFVKACMDILVPMCGWLIMSGLLAAGLMRLAVDMNIVRSVLPTGAIAMPRMMLELWAWSDVPLSPISSVLFQKSSHQFSTGFDP